MRKNELITKLSEKLGVSKKQASECLDVVDAVIDIVAEGEVNDKVKLGKGIILEKLFVEGRSGVCNGNEYITEDHYKIKVSGTQAMKNI